MNEINFYLGNSAFTSGMAIEVWNFMNKLPKNCKTDHYCQIICVIGYLANFLQ